MEPATKFVDVTVVVLVALALGGTMIPSLPDDGDEDGRSAVATTEDVILLFLALQFLSELLFLLLLACCCLVLLLLLRPADADALLDCKLDVLGFVLLLLGLFARPLDLGLALDLFLALVLDLNFPMMIKGVDVLAPWVRICVEVLGRNLQKDFAWSSRSTCGVPRTKIIIGRVAK